MEGLQRHTADTRGRKGGATRSRPRQSWSLPGGGGLKQGPSGSKNETLRELRRGVWKARRQGRDQDHLAVACVSPLGHIQVRLMAGPEGRPRPAGHPAGHRLEGA